MFTLVAHSPHCMSQMAFQLLRIQMDMFSFHIFHQEHQVHELQTGGGDRERGQIQFTKSS